MKKGFSLVELSIVLVILGLLVGGILAGQSLIRAAELRSVTTDLDKHRTALFAFRDKYFGLPGDITNATRFWGDQATGTGACADGTVPDGTPGTCNGNGDGKLAYASESNRAWQQLAMAGLIEGTYSGIGSYPVTTNAPRSRIANALFSIYWADAGGNGGVGADPNRLLFGAALATDTNSGPALRPEEAWNIDTKSDDGQPSQGRMRSRTATAGSPSGTCITGSNYTLDNTGIACYFTYLAD